MILLSFFLGMIGGGICSAITLLFLSIGKKEGGEDNDPRGH